MKKTIVSSKLHSLLSKFSVKETSACRKFLQSPYFNRSKELVILFNSIMAAKNESDKLAKDYLWKKLDKKKAYDDVRFRKYCSDLLRLVLDFLVLQEFENSDSDQKLSLLKVVEKRKAGNIYKAALKSAQESIEESRDVVDYHIKNYELERLVYEIENYDMRRDHISNIEQISSHLDKFFISEKLKIMCTSLSRMNTVSNSYTYDINMDQEIIDYVAKSNLIDDPRIRLYFYVYKSHTEDGIEEHFFALRDALKKFALTFTKYEAIGLYTFALNYCTRKINLGKKVFLNEIFKLYQDLIEKEIIIDHEGLIDPGHFKNIITVGLRLRQFQWTEDYIKKYTQYLPVDQREAALSYNMALLYFYQKQFDKALVFLQEVNYKDIYYNLNSKAMLLSIYYELEEIEALFSLLDSFGAFLNRQKKVPQGRRILYQNLIKYTRKLAKIIPGDKEAVAQLRKELEQNRKVASLQWLNEKIMELES